MNTSQLNNKNESSDGLKLKDDLANNSEFKKPWASNLIYAFMGVVFGIILVKAEIVSWFRIQEMFRFEAFHMYGVMGTGVLVGVISVFIIKKFNIKTLDGEKIAITPKPYNKGQIYGGLIFGLGWAITGACPGPLFAQIGRALALL